MYFKVVEHGSLQNEKIIIIIFFSFDVNEYESSLLFYFKNFILLKRWKKITPSSDSKTITWDFTFVHGVL